MRGSVNHSRKIIEKAIYSLKNEFGYPVDLYKVQKADYDPQTGLNNYNIEKIEIEKAVIFPTTMHRNFFFSISVIQANSQFVQGGDIQINDRQLIIDGKDLPRDYVINVDDYFVWEGKRYDIMKTEALEYKTGWTILGRRVQGSRGGQIHERTLQSNLTVFDSFGVEQNGL